MVPAVIIIPIIRLAADHPVAADFTGVLPVIAVLVPILLAAAAGRSHHQAVVPADFTGVLPVIAVSVPILLAAAVTRNRHQAVVPAVHIGVLPAIAAKLTVNPALPALQPPPRLLLPNPIPAAPANG